MNPFRRSRTRTAFTLVEILFVAVILIILIAIALPMYLKSVEKTRAVEAVSNLASIREAEMLYRAQHGTFTEALDLPTINSELDLELSSRYFDYAISKTDDSHFLIVATRNSGQGASPSNPFQVTMDHTGEVTFHWPGGGVSGSGGGGGGSGGGGGGGGGGGSSLGGGGGGGGGSGGNSGGSGPSGGNVGGGGSSGGSGGDSGGGSGGGSSGGGGGGSGGTSGGGSGTSGPLPSGGGGGRAFAYIPRGPDLWLGWPEANTKNIVGAVGVSTLSAAFDILANSSLSAITDDLFRRGIALSFDSTYFGTGLCGSAIACHVYYPSFQPPAEPAIHPFLVFNPLYLNEDPAILAVTIAHEGTHLQEYLDGRLTNPSRGTVDNEFDAFWNQSVFWASIRDTVSHASPLGREDEGVYQLAQQGEGVLRDRIAAVYCGNGRSNCEAGLSP